jgi:hypothetical protein
MIEIRGFFKRDRSLLSSQPSETVSLQLLDAAAIPAAMEWNRSTGQISLMEIGEFVPEETGDKYTVANIQARNLLGRIQLDDAWVLRC